MLSTRYMRNLEAISETQQTTLSEKTVLVAGCGGLGGYVIECLARVGVGHLVVVDGDVFEESNLNRQLLSSRMNLGKPKVLAAQQRVMAVNPQVRVDAFQMVLDVDSINGVMQGCDVVVDALDGIPARLLLQDAAQKAGIPLIHGAIAGWCGQVCVIQPGERKLDALYGIATQPKGAENEQGCLSFSAALVASIQAAEVVKTLLGVGNLIDGLLYIDLLQGTFTTFKLC